MGYYVDSNYKLMEEALPGNSRIHNLKSQVLDYQDARYRDPSVMNIGFHHRAQPKLLSREYSGISGTTMERFNRNASAYGPQVASPYYQSAEFKGAPDQHKLNKLEQVGKGLGAAKGFAFGGALFAGLEMLSGESPGTAVAKGFGEQILWTVAPGAMLGYIAATTLPQAGLWAAERVQNQKRWWNQAHRPNFGGMYKDTQQAMTMRQAAVQAISGSKLNARSALGGEARLMHRPY